MMICLPLVLSDRGMARIRGSAGALIESFFG